MVRLIMLLFVLAILGFGALTGYAYLADLEPGAAPVSKPVTLDVN